MRRIRFRVDGELPPKKHGKPKKGEARSMWGKKREAKRLIRLREGALAALGSQGPFTRDVRLTLRVHIGPEHRAQGNGGDLDNFVAGVCDGLMAAQQRPKHDSALWSKHPTVCPTRPIAFDDDLQVVQIDAKKFAINEPSWYRVVVTGE